MQNKRNTPRNKQITMHVGMGPEDQKFEGVSFPVTNGSIAMTSNIKKQHKHILCYNNSYKTTLII